MADRRQDGTGDQLLCFVSRDCVAFGGGSLDGLRPPTLLILVTAVLVCRFVDTRFPLALMATTWVRSDL